jgi:hypothetical protein
MRKYDGIDYRYKSGGQNDKEALGIITGILGFEPETIGLEYDLNLYSGGIGVHDRLAFCCSMTDRQIELSVNKLRLISPEEAIADPSWGEDFAWLLGQEGHVYAALDLSINFINQSRKPFQSSCSDHSHVLFSEESNVNTWTAVWIFGGIFNYLSFDQG